MVEDASPLSLDDMRLKKKTAPCKVRTIIDQLSEQERIAVEQALSQPKQEYPHTKIAEALSKRVGFVSDSVVRLHRVGACSCGR